MQKPSAPTLAGQLKDLKCRKERGEIDEAEYASRKAAITAVMMGQIKQPRAGESADKAVV